MIKGIKKAAVLGSGVMGSGIAALLAGVGITTYLLDIVPDQLTDEEAKKQLTLSHPAVKNRISNNNKQALLKSRPPLLYAKEDADFIITGNFEDDLDCLKEVDWIIEVVVENLAIKQQLYKKITPFIRKGTIIGTNTSGISINALAESLPEELRPDFFGTHFFNPVRYMNLFELIPSKYTAQEVIDFVASFAENKLGKGVVYAKDTPNFIANRIGLFSSLAAIRLGAKYGFGIEEVDSISGPIIGRPKTGTFKLTDMVGVDVAAAGINTVYESVKDSAEKELFALSPYLIEMTKKGLLGMKTGAGFYKSVKNAAGKKESYVLNLTTLEYEPGKTADIPVLQELKTIRSTAERMKKIMDLDDKAAKCAWETVKEPLIYSAAKIPEISDNILNIDNAMRWGYNWEFGPFQMWDAMGVEAFAARAEKDGTDVPAWVKEMLANGCKQFYAEVDGVPSYYCTSAKKYVPIPVSAEVIDLARIKQQGNVIIGNQDASLIDIGDGVTCFEIHSKANALNLNVQDLLKEAIDVVEKEEEYVGMVITSIGPNFCSGGDINFLIETQQSSLAERDAKLKALQDSFMKLKFAKKPAVAAPFQMTLGGGAELCMHCSAIQAHAETNMGLVEVGIGLIPGSGGIKELLFRWMGRIPKGIDSDPLPYVKKAFDAVMTAKVSGSAKEARNNGFLKDTDGISINRSHQLYDAKEKVLAMVADGYIPPKQARIMACGHKANALSVGAYNMMVGGQISEHDCLLAKKIVYVLRGGELPLYSNMDEDYVLGLERDVFVSLLDEPKTQERMQYMIKNGKPLRN
ncbi:MAG: 3-hydroxyacyl-CoA dehydrogenase/enoyl-CoA hydratase family protein [Ignavibacteriales bacterium]